MNIFISMFIISIVIIIIGIIGFSYFLIKNNIIKIKSYLFFLLLSSIILILPVIFKNFLKESREISDIYFKYLHFNGIFSIYYTIVSVIINGLVLWFYLWSFKKNAENIRLENMPMISLKPSFNKDGLIYLNLKNSGKTPAYNLKIIFHQDIPYSNSPYKTLNNLPLFNNLSFLDAMENITFFYDSAYEFFDQHPERETWEIKIDISYEANSSGDKRELVQKESYLSFKETSGICYIKSKTLGDIVSEINELKHAVVLKSFEGE